MSLQTCAKAKAGVVALCAAGVLILVMLAGVARPCFAQNTGELTPGMKSEPGWFAIEIPPIEVVDGRRVVMVSAPEAEWIVTNLGPFLNGQECSHALGEYSRGSLLDSDYQAYKAGRALNVSEDQVLADVQARSARCVVSDGSERFRTPGIFKTDPTTEFVR